jgi:hypothetical protein
MRSSGLVSFLMIFGFLVFFATRDRFDAPDAAEWLELAECREDTLLATLVKDGGVLYVRNASKLGVHGLLGVPLGKGFSNAE